MQGDGLDFDLAELDFVVVVLKTDVSSPELRAPAVENTLPIQGCDDLVAADFHLVGVPLIRRRIDGDQPQDEILNSSVLPSGR
jgi:hypothetical protein